MIRATLDANVLVSAFLNGQGPSARILRSAFDGQFVLCSSDTILDEFSDVVMRARIATRYGVTELQSAAFRTDIEDSATIVVVTSAPSLVSGDPKDDHVLEAVRLAHSDVLVTGDQHLLALQVVDNITIMSPVGFVAELLMRRDA